MLSQNRGQKHLELMPELRRFELGWIFYSRQAPGLRFALPIQAERSAMPAYDSVRFEYDEHRFPTDATM